MTKRGYILSGASIFALSFLIGMGLSTDWGWDEGVFTANGKVTEKKTTQELVDEYHYLEGRYLPISSYKTVNTIKVGKKTEIDVGDTLDDFNEGERVSVDYIKEDGKNKIYPGQEI